MQKVEKIKKEYSEKGNHSLLTVLFFYNSIVVLWPILFNSVSFLKSKSIYVALCVLIIAFVYAIMQRNLRLDKKCVVFPMLFIIWGLFSYALNEDTRSQMQTPMYWSLTQTLPAFMLIFSAKDYKSIFKNFLKVSYYMIPLYVIAINLADYYKIEVGYMVLSYALLPFVLITMQDMFKKVTRKNLIFFLIGLVTIVLKGARGALLCIIVAVILNTLFSVNGKKKYFSFILLTAFAIFLATPMYNDALLELSSFLQRHDMSSRTITKLANDEIQDDNGRSMYADAAIEWIKKAPVIGYGLCGDRVLIGRSLNANPSYPHNLLLELMMQLGTLGAVFFFWFFFKTLYVLIKVRDQYLKMIIMSTIPVVFVKLFLSSTYVAEIPFFMLLAIAFSMTRKRLKEINGNMSESKNAATQGDEVKTEEKFFDKIKEDLEND